MSSRAACPGAIFTFSTNPADTGSLYIHTPQPPTGGAPGSDPQVIQFFGAGDNIYIEEAESGPLTVTYTPPATGVNGTLLVLEGGTPIYRFGNFRGDPTLNYQAAETTITDPLTGTPGVAAIDVFVCFARGTRIRTPNGERRVETLREGELVLVADAGEARAKRVRWVGQRRLDLAAHARPELAAPIRFRAGALGEGLPMRDLLVSPDHALLIEGRLVRAKLLINGMSIVQERGLAAVSYSMSNWTTMRSCWPRVSAESYLDTGNRGFFANSGLPLVLHPDLMAEVPEAPSCAPHACSVAEVEPIWRTLAERARAMGAVAPQRTVSVDPDLRLLVNGTVVRPQRTRMDAVASPFRRARLDCGCCRAVSSRRTCIRTPMTGAVSESRSPVFRGGPDRRRGNSGSTGRHCPAAGTRRRAPTAPSGGGPMATRRCR